MASERNSARLNASKEQALQTLLRLKQMSDSKVTYGDTLNNEDEGDDDVKFCSRNLDRQQLIYLPEIRINWKGSKQERWDIENGTKVAEGVDRASWK